jgi:hypothetical protein
MGFSPRPQTLKGVGSPFGVGSEFTGAPQAAMIKATPAALEAESFAASIEREGVPPIQTCTNWHVKYYLTNLPSAEKIIAI